MPFICAMMFMQESTAQYQIRYTQVDSLHTYKGTLWKTQFADRRSTEIYVETLPALMHAEGYLSFSIDSIYINDQYAKIWIYVGERFEKTNLSVEAEDEKILKAIRWDKERIFIWEDWLSREGEILNYLENNGYPFAKVSLDSIRLNDRLLECKLKIERGPLYKVDSIRNHGAAKISSSFLQHYLGIANSSIYRKDQLLQISSRLNDLSFIKERRPWSMIRLGTGAIIDLDLESRKSNQMNVLVGFLPATNTAANPYDLPRTRMQFSGEAQIHLRNALSYGESISLDWQQLQPQAPRLDFRYQHPYILGSSWGSDLQFNLFKKDSSFMTVSMQLGADYAWNSQHSGTVFFQIFRSSLITVDTNWVQQTKKLPAEADIKIVSMGFSFEGNNTNFRYNPSAGNEWSGRIQAGTKKVLPQQVILQLKDPLLPNFKYASLYDSMTAADYQFTLEAKWAHYFPTSNHTTLKASVQVAWLGSKHIFRNDLYQIGGYRLLRGFDEQSIYASKFGVFTLEYRYLISRNSFLFTFADGAHVYTPIPQVTTHQYWGMGAGIALETKAGLFNMSLAAGKRNDLQWDLRQTKIHLGYLSYF